MFRSSLMIRETGPLNLAAVTTRALIFLLWTHLGTKASVS
jgi:hypothetical protein